MAGVRIEAIDKGTVHRICSGQVVLDLAAAVKELVENSLDAGATSVEIKLKEYGSEAIEVADNGSGVAPEDYQGLALKYHTSKLSEFSDLQALTSFGFRGEALSSLCALADVSILTRTKEQDAGTRLKYDNSGHIVSEECAARPVGTTVYVEKLFHPLPVRHKEFTRNIRREYAHMLSILQAYALISKDARLLCTNQLGKNRSRVFSTQGKGSIKENIVTVFGSKTLECLDPLNVTLSDEVHVEGFVSKPGSGSGRGSSDRQYFFLNGRPVEMPKASKLLNELYRSVNSQQYPIAVLDFHLPTTAYDVNVTPDKRKVFFHAEGELLSALRDALTKLYAPVKYTFMTQRVEAAVVSDTPEDAIETGVAECVREQDAGSTGKVDLRSYCCETRTTSRKLAAVSSSKAPMNSRHEGASAKKSSVQGKLTGFTAKRRSDVPLSEEPLLKRWSSSSSNKCSSVPLDGPLLKRGACSSCEEELPKKHNDGADSVTLDVMIEEPEAVFSSPMNVSCEQPVLLPRLAADHMPCEGVDEGRVPPGNPYLEEAGGHIFFEEEEPEPEEPEPEEPEPEVSELEEPEPEEPEVVPYVTIQTAGIDMLHEASEAEDVIPDNPLLEEDGEPMNWENSQVDEGFVNADPVDVHFDMEKLRNRIRRGLVNYQRSEQHSAGRGRGRKGKAFTAASVETGSMEAEKEKASTLAAATKELEKSFNKNDFKRMKVLGQFNLGFILAKLDRDIFIIDQHASDEKYNFERLSKSTVLNRQPLLKPLTLDLSAAEEMTISTHLETFKHNGFDFVQRDDAAPGERIKLSAVPFSKNILFGVADVQELLSLVSDEAPGPQARLVRPSRVRAMLASRACRSSIMIGDALSKKQMEKIVLHLADLDAPWNCPHGRPTMRHLIDLQELSAHSKARGMGRNLQSGGMHNHGMPARSSSNESWSGSNSSRNESSRCSHNSSCSILCYVISSSSSSCSCCILCGLLLLVPHACAAHLSSGEVVIQFLHFADVLSSTEKGLGCCRSTATP